MNGMQRWLMAAAVCAATFASAATNAVVHVSIGVSEPLCRKTACSCVADSAVRDYDAMIARVRERTGIVLEFHYYEDGQLLAKEIKEGRLDGMLCKTWTGLTLARDAGRKCVRLADITMPGAAKSDLTGIFVVLTNSTVRSVTDLGGKRIAFGQKVDYEKYYLAFETLKKAGIAVPDKRIEDFSCQTAALDLLEKRADVAVISSYALKYGCIKVVGDPEDFRVIGETDAKIPFTSLFVDTVKVPAELRAKLAAALLELKGDRVPKGLFSSGWVEPTAWNPPELGQ